MLYPTELRAHSFTFNYLRCRNLVFGLGFYTMCPFMCPIFLRCDWRRRQSRERLHRRSEVHRTQVRISESHRKALVPQDFLNLLERSPAHRQMTRRRVAQVVEAEIGQSRPLNGHLERRADLAPVPRSPTIGSLDLTGNFSGQLRTLQTQ